MTFGEPYFSNIRGTKEKDGKAQRDKLVRDSKTGDKTKAGTACKNGRTA